MALVSGEITFIHLLYIEDNFIYLKKRIMILLCLGITFKTALLAKSNF